MQQIILRSVSNNEGVALPVPHAACALRISISKGAVMAVGTQDSSAEVLLVIDLEATCFESPELMPTAMEIIEVGACVVVQGQIIDRFQAFVRPLERPQLTEFCRSLTGIRQTDVDRAVLWPEVAHALATFAARHQLTQWASWGAFDRQQITRDCARHGCADPLAGIAHRNLKREFAKARRIREVGMSRALAIVGLMLEGSHHRALDDACNIARLLPEIIKKGVMA